MRQYWSAPDSTGSSRREHRAKCRPVEKQFKAGRRNHRSSLDISDHVTGWLAARQSVSATQRLYATMLSNDGMPRNGYQASYQADVRADPKAATEPAKAAVE